MIAITVIIIMSIIIVFFATLIIKNKLNNLNNKDIAIINNVENLNKNLKQGEALNFTSYGIPEIKGYHFDFKSGKGYVRNKKQRCRYPLFDYDGFANITGANPFIDD